MLRCLPIDSVAVLKSRSRRNCGVERLFAAVTSSAIGLRHPPNDEKAARRPHGGRNSFSWPVLGRLSLRRCDVVVFTVPGCDERFVPI